jgi:hypothetical protein
MLAIQQAAAGVDHCHRLATHDKADIGNAVGVRGTGPPTRTKSPGAGCTMAKAVASAPGGAATNKKTPQTRVVARRTVDFNCGLPP